MSTGFEGTIQEIPIDEIHPNPYQPRTEFEQGPLEDLARSIEAHGVMQPIIVRKSIKGYTLVAGERRLRASKLAHKTTIPAIIKSLSDEEMMILSVIENLQRENLTPLEEAESYKHLMERLNLTQQEVADTLGKSRPYIANMVRLLSLPSEVRELIRNEKLTSAHGRTLLGLKDYDVIINVAKRAVREHWNVRTLEEYVNLNSGKTKPPRTTALDKPKLIKRYEQQLKEKFGTNAEIKIVKKTGHINLQFNSENEFKRLIDELLE